MAILSKGFTAFKTGGIKKVFHDEQLREIMFGTTENFTLLNQHQALMVQQDNLMHAHVQWHTFILSKLCLYIQSKTKTHFHNMRLITF